MKEAMNALHVRSLSLQITKPVEDLTRLNKMISVLSHIIMFKVYQLVETAVKDVTSTFIYHDVTKRHVIMCTLIWWTYFYVQKFALCFRINIIAS